MDAWYDGIVGTVARSVRTVRGADSSIGAGA